MLYSRTTALLLFASLGCTSSAQTNESHSNSITLNVEEAAVVRLDGGERDLKVGVKTANESDRPYCELATEQNGRAEPPQAYFIFYNKAGPEIFADFNRPQFSDSPLEPQNYRIFRRPVGSTSIDEYYTMGDLVPDSVRHTRYIRIKAARILFSCNDASGDPLPEVFSISDQSTVAFMKQIFSHFDDNLIFSPEFLIETMQ